MGLSGLRVYTLDPLIATKIFHIGKGLENFPLKHLLGVDCILKTTALNLCTRSTLYTCSLSFPRLLPSLFIPLYLYPLFPYLSWKPGSNRFSVIMARRK